MGSIRGAVVLASTVIIITLIITVVEEPIL